VEFMAEILLRVAPARAGREKRLRVSLEAILLLLV